MAIVNTEVPITSQSCNRMILELVQTYPGLRTELLTRTVFQRPIRTLVIGTGARKVFYSASHHANEWITSLVLLKFAEEFARAVAENGTIFDADANALAQAVTIYIVPMVNPDGVDLVTGTIPKDSAQYALAKEIAREYPSIPFPDGWKANLLGVDLNLNYPAGWEQAMMIKFQQGYIAPAPRDYVGKAPLNQVETRAIAGYTQALDPDLILAYHSQGEEIYWRFLDYEVDGAEKLGEELAQVSGYTLSTTPYASGFAGYKDWFIQEYRRPGYTIEVGKGENPLPLAQFPKIYEDNLGILVTAARGI